MKLKSICLVLPYFGMFPNYFKLWLSSCRVNSTIDFLLITDNENLLDCPSNVHVVQMKFTELVTKVRACLGRKVSLNKPYKLCDFKPMYGVLFEDLLKGYDFWGHCDCDLIFGDIRRFITDDVLNRYDRILTRGHLTIYRNCNEVNQFFMNQVDGVVNWETVVSSEAKPFCFDEWGGTSALWKKLAPDKMYDEIVYDDITYRYKHFVSSQKVRFSSEEKHRDYVAFSFDETGLRRLYLDDREPCVVKSEPSCYVHFQKRPMKVKTDNVSRFLIIPDCFMDNGGVDVRKLKRWGRHRLICWNNIRIRFNNLKRKFKV